MIKLLALSRLTVVAAVIVLLNAIGLLAIGIAKSVSGFANLYASITGPEWLMPGALLAESTDSILLSLVLFVLALGIIKIFAFPDVEPEKLPRWLNFSSLGELKAMVWEALLLTLTVIFVTDVFGRLHHLDELPPEFLILPAAVLILAASLRIVRWKEK